MRRTLALVLVAVSVGCGGQVKSSGDDQGVVNGSTTTPNASTTGETMTSGGAATTEGAAGAGATMVAPGVMGGSGGTSQAGGAGSGSAGGIIVIPPAQDVMPSCPTHNPLNNQTFASIDEKRHALVGRWTQCSKQGIGGGTDSVGIEITSDGLFTVFVRDASGAIVPGRGGLLQGYVEVTPNDVAFVSGNVHQLTSMQFSDEVPYRMYAYNTDFIGFDYIRLP